MRWADLFSIEVPQDLYHEIEKQRLACERIIASKDKLITEIKNELKKKDDEYVKTLKRQAEDIDLLLQFMSQQYLEMQNAYKDELQEIEAAFMEERAELLDGNHKEMQDLFDKRSKMEQDFLDRYLAQVEVYQKQLEELRNSDAEDCNILKIKLESDIQVLNQHLEDMRAIYQLNTEKLEYNHRVLVERDAENQATITQQKRKIGRQRDLLSSLKQRYADSDRKYAEDNARLADEYKRITEQFKDLQAKFRHFEALDVRRFHEVWNMKEAEVVALAKKLMLADKVIHEQQLGWDWCSPSQDVFVSPHSQEAAAAAAALPEADEEDAEQVAHNEMQERLVDPRHSPSLALLRDEAGFLVEAKVAALLERLPRDEGGQVAADAILHALGVVDGPSFDMLMDALTQGSNIELRARGLGRGDEAEPASERSTTLVHPDDVVRRLKAFVDAEHSTPTRGLAAGSRPVAGIGRRQAEREKEFWQRLVNVVSDKTFRQWGALERHLGEYAKVLQLRAESLRDVEGLQQQNNELRGLLHQYLSSRINEQLILPPTVLI